MGGQTLPPLLIAQETTDMARQRISARKHSRKFNKARKRTKAINSPSHFLRGGRRL